MGINNLELWEKVEKTDPKHTKEVRTGGRKMTSINAQYQIKNATEQFGKYGEAWGLKELKYTYLDVDKGQILAVVRGIFFYPKGEFEVGSSIFVQQYIQSKSYLKVDDDFVKKVETDMVTKSLSKLGFNADVFFGNYDDNRYVNAVNQEFREAEKKNEPPKRLDAKQKKSMMGWTDVTHFEKVLKTFVLSDKEKKYIKDKIKELSDGKK